MLITLFWAGLIIGVAFAVIWRFTAPGPLRTFFQTAGALLVFLPQLAILFLMNQSISLFLYQRALLTLWFFAVGGVTSWRFIQRMTGKNATPKVWSKLDRWRKTEGELAFESRLSQGFAARRQQSNPAVLLLLAFVMTGSGIYFGRQFLLDAFYPRIEVRGQVERLSFRSRRAARVLMVVINGRSFAATRDLARQLHVGDQIRAEVGAGSDTILNWQAD